MIAPDLNHIDLTSLPRSGAPPLSNIVLDGSSDSGGIGNALLKVSAAGSGYNFSQNIGSALASISANATGYRIDDYGNVRLGLTAEADGFFGDGLAQLPLEVEVVPATVVGHLEIGLQITVAEPQPLTLPLSVIVYDATLFPGHNGTAAGGTFSVRVEIGGEDYSSRLIGSIEIDAEEDAARVANLAVVLPAGEFEPDDWINLPLVIDYIQGDADFRLFTGIVDLPQLSLEDNSVTLSCTDNRQGRFEDQSRATIEAQFAGTGAKWSPAVFGEYSASDQLAEDLLSTIPASAELDRNGQLVFAPWYSPSPDFVFQDREVFPESVSVEWGSRRDIITRVNIEAEYTYQFFRERRHRYSWVYPRTFADYLALSTSLPNSSMIESAANADGWTILGKPSYQRLPESGEYDLPGGGSTNWIISDEVRQSVAIGADFVIGKRWIQDARETYRIIVQSSPNIERFGLLAEDLRVGLDTSQDDYGFEGFEADPDAPPVSLGSDTAWSTFDASGIETAIDVAVARAGVIILESMRQNSVSFATLIQPELERHHHARLEQERVTAEGKIRRVRHTIDLSAGSAVSEIELAVFRGEAADGQPAEYQGLEYDEMPASTFTLLHTALQDFSGSIEEPGEAFEGYVGNYLSQLNNVPNPFDERFAILTPEISDESRNAVEYSEDIQVEAETHNQIMLVNL